MKMEISRGLNSIETFYGMIETTSDALRIFDLCRQGKLGRVRRRLHDRERRLIRSGSVFCFDELESGIRRWTDGRLWSPSRILGNFLIYRELDRKVKNGETNEENPSINPITNGIDVAASTNFFVDREPSWLEQTVMDPSFPPSSTNTGEVGNFGISPLSIFGNNNFKNSKSNCTTNPVDGNKSDAMSRLDASWKSMTMSNNVIMKHQKMVPPLFNSSRMVSSKGP